MHLLAACYKLHAAAAMSSKNSMATRGTTSELHAIKQTYKTHPKTLLCVSLWSTFVSNNTEKVSADSVYGQQHQPGSFNSWDNGIGYALATILLRLPGHAPMLSFNHIMDIPLIVPHAKLSQEQVSGPPHMADRHHYL